MEPGGALGSITMATGLPTAVGSLPTTSLTLFFFLYVSSFTCSQTNLPGTACESYYMTNKNTEARTAWGSPLIGWCEARASVLHKTAGEVSLQEGGRERKESEVIVSNFSLQTFCVRQEITEMRAWKTNLQITLHLWRHEVLLSSSVVQAAEKQRWYLCWSVQSQQDVGTVRLQDEISGKVWKKSLLFVGVSKESAFSFRERGCLLGIRKILNALPHNCKLNQTRSRCAADRKQWSQSELISVSFAAGWNVKALCTFVIQEIFLYV